MVRIPTSKVSTNAHRSAHMASNLMGRAVHDSGVAMLT